MTAENKYIQFIVTGTLRHKKREDTTRFKFTYLHTNKSYRGEQTEEDGIVGACWRTLDQEGYGIWAVNTKLRKRLEEYFRL